MKRFTLMVALVACACPKKTEGPTGGSGDGSQGAATGAGGTPCDAIRAKVEQLYRAEAQAKEPKRVDEAVADNTAMVMADCAKAPTPVVACVNRAASVAEIETTCLAPLDDEGTEGDKRNN